MLLLGGLDPSGGAGITVDATVAALHGAEPLPIALATTVQGLRGFVTAEPIAESVWREQIATVLADGKVGAVKVGYLGDPRVLAAVAEVLRPLRERVPVVVDPVLSATAGGMAGSAELVAAYREQLVPLATLLTPNAPELQQLAAGDPEALLRAGAGAVLCKGGHGDGDQAVDELWTGEPPFRFARERFACGPVRGTGCALASAIAARLADRCGLVEACRLAGDWLASLLAGVKPRPSGLPRLLPLTRGGTAPR
ncbi:MAG: hydroxymethylpyrimidine/phosphomethylpyrimidine kinase [Planctomycetes bacterium]|nr:hydroxymethylpyrimidine/phosphomethylpyrimidine kinase [Planctomycetota bacterium]